MINRNSIYKGNRTTLKILLRNLSDEELKNYETEIRAKKNATNDSHLKTYYLRRLILINMEQQNRQNNKFQEPNNYKQEIVEDTTQSNDKSANFEDLFEEIFTK